jgi:D-lactate dehydrogenase (cytochrome)
VATDTCPRPATDPALFGDYLEDASGSPSGTASGLLRPEDEASAAAFLRSTVGDSVPVLPQAGRSSLTAGAIPNGEVVLSVEGLADIGAVAGEAVRVGAGVRLDRLRAELGELGYDYPPVPTHQQAMLGGTVATNAGGAATFKYGVTRDWVRALRVLLFNGDLLEIERGEAVVDRGGEFRIVLSDGRELHVPSTRHRLPAVKKISAGYHAADRLDLLDLFVGSEGTLGLITEATVGVIPLPRSTVTGLAFAADLPALLALAGALRDAATRARQERDLRGPDVRSIELIDGRSLEMLETSGDIARLRFDPPAGAGAALLFETELPETLTDDEAQEQIAGLWEEGAAPPDTPLVRLLRILQRHGALDTVDLALPQDTGRRAALAELSERVPTRFSELLARRRRTHVGLKKAGGDMIVPFDRLPEFFGRIDEALAGRGLDHAVWGHLSDGNLHPNVLPEDHEQAAAGIEALLELADAAARLGGSPLSEHGVGRNPTKQLMLRRFLGDDAIRGMQAVKRALDPGWRFAPGVLFPIPPPASRQGFVSVE